MSFFIHGIKVLLIDPSLGRDDFFGRGAGAKVVAEKLLLKRFSIGWTFFPSQIRPQKRSRHSFYDRMSLERCGSICQILVTEKPSSAPHSKAGPLQMSWLIQFLCKSQRGSRAKPSRNASVPRNRFRSARASSGSARW